MNLKAEQRGRGREDLEWVGPTAEGCLGLGGCKPGAPARQGTERIGGGLGEGAGEGGREQREKDSETEV